MRASAVPTIDIGPFLGGDAAAGRAVAGQVAETCERTGFLIISGHGFPLDLLERAKALLFAFFDLPEDTKNRWHPTGAVEAARLPRLRHPRPRVHAGPADAAGPAGDGVPRTGRRPSRLLRGDARGGDELRAQPDSHRAGRARADAGCALPRLRAPRRRHDAGLRGGAPAAGGVLRRRAGAPLQHHVVPSLPGAHPAAAARTAPHRRPYRLRRHDDPRRDRRPGRARGAPARRQLGGRDAAPRESSSSTSAT